MRAEISDYFSVEYSPMICEHRNRIKYILSHYDVAIFMARKSICLLRALIENGEVDEGFECQILSSRALSYSCIDSFKDKKVAIIDDVVVFGKTIMTVMKRLKDSAVDADVFIMACERDFFNEVSFKDRISEGCQYLKAEEIHQISNQITEYIVCSGVSYNVDQPIFTISFETDQEIESKIYNNNIITGVADGMQSKCDIENFTIHFNSEVAENCNLVDKNDGMPLLKIRFIRKKDEKKLSAIPFVLLPELTYKEVEKLYTRIIGEKYDNWVICEDKKHEIKNKLKLLHYVLSENLFYKFIETNDIIDVKKDIGNEGVLFPFAINDRDSYKNIVHECRLDYKNEVQCIEDRFLFDQLMSATYEYLTSCADKVITYRDLHCNLKENFGSVNMYLISAVADVLIDKGILVPSIHNDSEVCVIERGFRFGEIFKLNEDVMNLFQYMLRHYQLAKRAEFDRTEFEKLCVIFLRKIGYISKGILSAAKEYSEDNYSICYTRFGPRISSSSSKIDVPSYTTFARRMLSEHRMVNTDTKKYVVKDINTSFPDGWEMKAVNFATSYAKMAACFGGPASIHNKYVRSLNDFLTIVAIGRKNEDRLYSLVAELRLFDKIDTEQELKPILHDMHNYADNNFSNGRYRGIMDGIASGMWKYVCFMKPNLVSSVFQDAYSLRKDDSARYLQEDYMSETIDTNPQYDAIISKCAEVLYRVGFCFETAYQRYVNPNAKHIFRDVVYDIGLAKSIIDEYESIENEYEFIDEFQKLQLRIRAIVDETNMIAEKHSYLPDNTYENCFLLRDDKDRELLKGDKRFRTGNEQYWIVIPRDPNKQLGEQVSIIKESYKTSGEELYCLDLSDEYLGFLQNGTEIKGSNISDILGALANNKKPQINIKCKSIYVVNMDSYNMIKEAKMGDNYTSNYNSNVGIGVNGKGNRIEQPIIQQNQASSAEIYEAIKQIELNRDVFSSKIIDEIEEIKVECEKKTDDEESKFKGIMKKLAEVVGKFSIETVKAVIPKVVMAALTNGGFLPIS